MKYLNSLLLLPAIAAATLLFSDEIDSTCDNAVPPNQLSTNIALLDTPPSLSEGMDIIIVSASSPALAAYWEKRLDKTRPHLLPAKALVICVDEDWAKGGAGNGLGTLYALKKGQEKAKAQLGIDILERQAQGAAIAIYHTAGIGKRLAPLTICENGIKSAVELPGLLHPLSADNPDITLITLLEATIKQSMLYGASRKGRVSVFWSDQVFIPSNACMYAADSHIDILVKIIPDITLQSWQAQNLDNYGLLAWDGAGIAKLFDKCSFTTFQEIFASNKAMAQKGVAISMGAFSLSLPMAQALLDEFAKELADKTVLLDSDPCFWMPMTLDLETYAAAMQVRQVSSAYIERHYARMQRFKTSFQKQHDASDLNFFCGVDIGRDSYWWDYGTVDSYYRNNIMMTKAGKESALMRQFYRLPAEENSILIGCHIGHGNCQNSLLLNVSAENLTVKDTIMLGCTTKNFTATSVLAYHIDECEPLALPSDSVRADITLPATQQHLKLLAPLASDGKTNWKAILPGNLYSWEKATELVSVPSKP